MGLLNEGESYTISADSGDNYSSAIPTYDSEPNTNSYSYVRDSLKSGGSLNAGNPYASGSGGYSGGAPLVFANDVWNANVGKTSGITGGQRTINIGGGSGGASRSASQSMSYNPGYIVGNTEYKQSAIPTYKSTYVAPDERKINALTASGGGNALRASVAQLVNRTIASSAALPLAVRRQQMRQLNEEIAGTYSKSMPNIRRGAANEWQGLYGRPQSESIAHENTYNMQVWLNNEKNRLAEYMGRLNAGVKTIDSQQAIGSGGSNVINMMQV